MRTLLPAFLLISFGIHAQNFLPSQLNADLLKKKHVKTVTITERSFDPRDSLKTVSSFTYVVLEADRNGRIISENFHSGEQIWKYTYDSKGHLTGSSHLDKNGRAVYTSVIAYDAAGRKTLVVFRDHLNPSNNGKEEFRWNEKGKPLSDVRSDTTGKIVSAYYYSYDKNDSLLFMTFSNGYSESTTRMSDHMIMKQVTFDGKSQLVRQTRFTYDSLKRITAETDSFPGGKTQQRKFTYDVKGLSFITDDNGKVLYDREKAKQTEDMSPRDDLRPVDDPVDPIRDPKVIVNENDSVPKPRYYKNGLVRTIWLFDSEHQVIVHDIKYTGY